MIVLKGHEYATKARIRAILNSNTDVYASDVNFNWHRIDAVRIRRGMLEAHPHPGNAYPFTRWFVIYNWEARRNQHFAADIGFNDPARSVKPQSK